MSCGAKKVIQKRSSQLCIANTMLFSYPDPNMCSYWWLYNHDIISVPSTRVWGGGGVWYTCSGSGGPSRLEMRNLIAHPEATTAKRKQHPEAATALLSSQPKLEPCLRWHIRRPHCNQAGLVPRPHHACHSSRCYTFLQGFKKRTPSLPLCSNQWRIQGTYPPPPPPPPPPPAQPVMNKLTYEQLTT